MNAPVVGSSTSTRAGRWAPSEGYRSVVVGFLVAAYTINFVDRTVIGIIGQAIKVDLKITDTQLGLLGGMAFAILYTVLGIPIARAAERFNRVTIISMAMVVWSAFTVACGFAGSFLGLLALRVGVGVGEAGCSPPAHSLISDYYEPRRRASALSVYAFGIPLGGMIGAVAGGWLAKTVGWRAAFMVVGAPGVVIALLLKLVVREPPRGATEALERPTGPEDLAPHAVDAPPRGHWLARELSELWIVTRQLFGSWPVLNMILGVTLVSVGGYGVGQFSAPYFNRAFGLDYATVGLIFGVIGGVSTGLGTLAGGFIADRASRRGGQWYALTPAIGLAIATPIYLFAYSRLDWRIAAAILLVPGIFHYTYLGPTFGVVQNVVEPRRRATATAVMFLFLNLIALGGGPLLTGWFIDRLGEWHFSGHGGEGLWSAFAGIFKASGDAFAHGCPGGLAPKGAPASAAAACHTALVTATRQGILVTVLFYGWGALHYLLASFGLARRLATASSLRA
ncbi:MAG TPA: MFS transporter [Caulobacteraceae bacterium]|jgi:predicted MFS family arabinose efflux permease|nr:MFS transporter [Caulobacteraceae bacterium]